MGKSSLVNSSRVVLIFALFAFMGFACEDKKEIKIESNRTENHRAAVKYPKYEILEEYTHDSTLFTQGLFYSEGKMYESGGMRGQSRLVRYSLGQKIEQTHKMPDYIFSEGICQVEDKIYMLSYQAGKCFVFDKNTFQEEKTFNYIGEGWGIEYHEGKIYMTDGSSVIRVLDPKTFVLEKTINVTINGNKLEYLNELEFAKGYLYANIWMNSSVVKIDINSGEVVAAYNLSELIDRVRYNPAVDVLNGIAYDETEDVFYMTGKLWPKIFKVKLGE